MTKVVKKFLKNKSFLCVFFSLTETPLKFKLIFLWRKKSIHWSAKQSQRKIE